MNGWANGISRAARAAGTRCGIYLQQSRYSYVRMTLSAITIVGPFLGDAGKCGSRVTVSMAITLRWTLRRRTQRYVVTYLCPPGGRRGSAPCPETINGSTANVTESSRKSRSGLTYPECLSVWALTSGIQSAYFLRVLLGRISASYGNPAHWYLWEAGGYTDSAIRSGRGLHGAFVLWPTTTRLPRGWRSWCTGSGRGRLSENGRREDLRS